MKTKMNIMCVIDLLTIVTLLWSIDSPTSAVTPDGLS